MKSILIAFIAVALWSKTLALKYKDCGSTGNITNVQVSGCEDKDVCPLKKGSSAAMSVDFQSGGDAKSTKAVVHGYIANIPMPFPPPESDGCKNSGLQCPLEKGKDYTYTTDIPVRSSYPEVNVDVKWELQDENSRDIFCVVIPAKITS